MSAKIFLSYRTDDSAHAAGRLHDRLSSEFDVFLDVGVNGIPLGAKLVKFLNAEVAQRDVLLLVIGRNLLDARDAQGKRRLDDPNDYVRIEIAAALRGEIPVIPIVLDQATVPKKSQLPRALKQLSDRAAFEIRHASFPDDVARLIARLRSVRVTPAPRLTTKLTPKELPPPSALTDEVTSVTAKSAPKPEGIWRSDDGVTVMKIVRLGLRYLASVSHQGGLTATREMSFDGTTVNIQRGFYVLKVKDDSMEGVMGANSVKRKVVFRRMK